MEWAKIEIEFPPSTHDPNEVMQFLTEHFRHPSGVPTATITLVGVGADEPEDERAVCTYGSSGTLVWGGGRPPSSVKAGALAIAKALPYKKIQAIKEMRGAYNIDLKEAKDFIDEAFVALGL